MIKAIGPVDRSAQAGAEVGDTALCPAFAQSYRPARNAAALLGQISYASKGKRTSPSLTGEFKAPCDFSRRRKVAWHNPFALQIALLLTAK